MARFRMKKKPQTNLINLKSTCFIEALRVRVPVTLPQTHTEAECKIAALDSITEQVLQAEF